MVALRGEGNPLIIAALNYGKCNHINMDLATAEISPLSSVSYMCISTSFAISGAASLAAVL